MDAQRGIARRFVIGLPPEGIGKAWEKDFSAFPPAGVIIFKRDFRDLEDLRLLTARLRDLARPRRLFIATDEEGGHVSQLAGHLVVPPNALLLGRGAEPGDIEWVSRVTAERLRALGIDWVFAPVADVHSRALNPVIGPRAFSTAPGEVAERVAEAVRGLRAGGVASCLKHFPGHGDTVLDSHLALPTCTAPRAELAQRELVPFRANLGADAVMSAHVVYPALDAEHPATFSPAVLQNLLRRELGFGGVCITDALEMKGAAEGRDTFETGRLALEAGCDLLLFAFHNDELRRVRLELSRALVDGKIGRASFDAARPRLARLDGAHRGPSAAELGKPIGELTPADWESRLERVVERGLIVRGALAAPAAGALWVEEPEWKEGRSLSEELSGLGVPVSSNGPAGLGMVAVASRKPLPAEEIDGLRARCNERPTILVGLQNDAFLDALPEAALRISAADSTPLTRRVVARLLAQHLKTAARAGV